MKTAKFLKHIPGWTGDARAYELSEHLDGHMLVIVSATVVPYGGGPETYIFPASTESLKRNDCSHWGELHGSYRGGLSHEEALRNAGYEVAP